MVAIGVLDSLRVDQMCVFGKDSVVLWSMLASKSLQAALNGIGRSRSLAGEGGVKKTPLPESRSGSKI